MKILRFLILLWTFNANAMESAILHAFTLDGSIGEARDGSSYGFDLAGWVGDDYDKFWLNVEKKKYGNFEQKFELQTLYSRNISQFFDAQIGFSQDFDTDFTSNDVSYFVAGFQGLAPYSFETQLQFFVSDEGNYSARLKQEIDIFVTQRLIAQPYFEVELMAQDVEELEVKSGLSDFEIGVNTRYELSRKFAPFLDLRYHAKAAATAKLARRIGERVDNFIALAGVRVRF